MTSPRANLSGECPVIVAVFDDRWEADQAIDRGFGPLEHGFDAPVCEVADRTAEARAARLMRACVAEEDSLDASAHEDARADVAAQYLGMLGSI